MRIKIIAFIIIVLPIFWCAHVCAESNGHDQASNLARVLKETPIPTDVTFSKGVQTVEGPVQKMHGDTSAKFTLKEIILTGNEIFSTEELSSIWQPYLSKEVTLEEVQNIAHAITQHYREQGYILAQAILPVQDIMSHEGNVTVQVLEGILGAVRVEGGGPSEQAIVEGQLEGMPLGRPFNLNDLERRLINIKKTPGIVVQSVLVPSEDKSGNTDLVFKIGKTTYADGSVSYNNGGNKYSGIRHMGTDVTAYNLIGRSKLTASYLRSTESFMFDFYRIRQTQLLGDAGTRAYVEFITVGDRIKIPLLNKSSYKYANVMLMHPLIAKRDKSLRIRFALDGQNDVSTYAGQMIKNDHIRAGRLGLLYNQAGEEDFWEISGVLNQGFSHAFGARPTAIPSRKGGKNDFRYLSARGAWIHKFNNYFSISNMIGYQRSADPLLATEEFSAGASNYVRGYDSTESTADNGFGALTEIRLNVDPSISNINSVQFYTSFGGAALRNHKEKVDSVRKDKLLSFAAGVRTVLFDRLNCALQAGKPLSRRAGILKNKKWHYTAMFSLGFDFSKDWDKTVKAPDDPLAGIDE